MQTDCASEKDGAEFVMTCPRLNTMQAAVLIAVCAGAFLAAPSFWYRLEPFSPDQDYRVPYELSDDYGLYRRIIDRAVETEAILMIGDSVIWGEYTKPSDTLAQCVQSNTADRTFMNGGVNGLHPIAMEGLVRHYGRKLKDRKVLIHCNLLWLTSRERDLSSPEEQSFNHEKLVPQFNHRWPFVTSSVPSYRSQFSERLKIAIDRKLAYRDVVQHFRDVNFDGRDIHSWSIRHPHENPLRQITSTSPTPKTEPRHKERDWRKSGARPRSFEWVPLEESRQWKALLSTTKLLRARGNHVFVLVGPFNSHMLLPENRQRHQDLRMEVANALSDRQVDYFAPQVLPTELYGDVSHPLAMGYRELAAALMEDRSFQLWLDRGE